MEDWKIIWSMLNKEGSIAVTYMLIKQFVFM